jgi:hypothetical protein
MSVPNGLIINPSPGFYNGSVNLNIKVDTSLSIWALIDL